MIYNTYFDGPRERGNTCLKFLESINEVFICLVVSAIRHCLKAWLTGVFVKPTRSEQFKYATTISKYNFSGLEQQVTFIDTYTRFLPTWEKLTDVVKKLLIATMKAELQARIATAKPKKCDESAEPNSVVDPGEYEKELQEELQVALNAAKLPRRRNDDCEQSPPGENVPPPDNPLIGTYSDARR